MEKGWAPQGLILDLTDEIKNSPYASDYNEDYFTPFKDEDGNIYGFPALTGGTCTVVVYDSKAWSDAGYALSQPGLYKPLSSYRSFGEQRR